LIVSHVRLYAFASDEVPKSMKPSPHDAVVPKRRGLPSSWGSMVMPRKPDSMLSVVNNEDFETIEEPVTAV
jgi:hypothetical protein